jgi:hypothetical protein
MIESNEFLLNAKTLRITIYLSLAIANMIFGALYPELMVIAGCGFAFFAALTLMNLRPEAPTKSSSSKKALHFDK